ncbi:MAG: cell division protein ZapE, partial [Hyphomicrobiales bacterium]
VHGAIHQWRQQRRAGTAQGDDPLAPVAAEIARKATLLCFDEFQVTDVADAMILKRLFEYLFEAGVVLVATSNTAPEDLYAHGLNRPLFLPFIGLLNQRMDVLHLAGARDFRRGRGAADDRYFSPLGPNATQAMDAAWAHTSAGLPVGPVRLSVAGRPLLVPLAAGRAARFSFAQLCQAPLGAGDYQILAENFDRIFIDDIPSLTDAGRNVVQRVIAMIDTFYETGIELCVSAAVQPDFLYANGRDAGRFARAASRLQEMRAPGYPPDRLAANNRDIRQTGVPGATT